MESAARLASTGAQRARDARPHHQKRFSTGTAMEYRALIHRFELAVNQPGMDSRAKLTEMQFWFSGQAARIIDCYMSLSNSEVAYKTARAHLDQTFGSTVDSLTPLIERITSGNQIGEWDLGAHVTFSIDLLEAEVLAHNIGRFDQLDTRENIFKIVNGRLQYMKREFLLRDGEMHPESNTTWSGLKERIQTWIRGLSADKSANPQPAKPAKPADAPAKLKHSAPPQLVVDNQKSTNHCNVCGDDDHPTSTCWSLAQMQMSKKLETIRKRFLCVHCLEKGHIGRDCPNVPTCSICRGEHNTLLHGRPKLDFKRQHEDVNNIPEYSNNSALPMTPTVVDADASTGNLASSGETEAS